MYGAEYILPNEVKLVGIFENAMKPFTYNLSKLR